MSSSSPSLLSSSLVFFLIYILAFTLLPSLNLFVFHLPSLLLFSCTCHTYYFIPSSSTLLHLLSFPWPTPRDLMYSFFSICLYASHYPTLLLFPTFYSFSSLYAFSIFFYSVLPHPSFHPFPLANPQLVYFLPILLKLFILSFFLSFSYVTFIGRFPIHHFPLWSYLAILLVKLPNTEAK